MWGLGTGFYSHCVHTGELDAKTNVTVKCEGCRILQEALELAGSRISDRQRHSLFIKGSAGRLTVSVSDGRIEINTPFLNLPGVQNGDIVIDIFTLPEEPCVPSLRVAPLLRETSIEANLGDINSWIAKCEESHTQCVYTTTFLPKRLLNIRPDGIVSLVEQAALTAANEATGLSIRYACISHCWGKTRSRHITHRSSLTHNMNGIPVLELPKTFQDAVYIVQSLGMKYLWIDSLCIVQDDDEEWDAHVNEMAQIYQNAYITLAAGDGVDDDAGFFLEPEAEFNEVRALEVSGTEGERIRINMRILPPHPGASSTMSPLEQRGWIFQERFLSRRFLCFRRNEIQWECLCDVACTCSSIDGCFNAQYIPDLPNPSFPESTSVKWKLARLNNMEKNNVLALWREMVGVYSQKLLSFEKDKLPALAGLAKLFAVALNDSYLHGHWEQELKYSLIWQRGGHGAGFGRPARDHPSWSWASAADGDMILWAQEIERRSTSFELISVQEKRLTVAGYLSLISLHLGNDLYVSPGDKHLKVDHWCEVSQIDGPSPTSKSRKRFYQAMRKDFPRKRIFLPSQAYFNSDYRFWTHKQELRKSLAQVYFLDLTGRAELDVFHGEGSPGEAKGMVLRKRDGGNFERIGMLTFVTTLPNRDPSPEDIHWYPTGSHQTVVIE